MNESDYNHRTFLICLFLVISVIAIYWQVNNHDFVNFDDNKYITENRYVQTGLTSGNITWAFTTFHAGNWHPLTWISHMLDCQLFGLNPGLHHLVNIFFHIANTLLLFFILHRMTKGLWQSAFVAAVFAIHPLHVESVAWVAERKDVLSTLFWTLTMGAYVFYVERRELKRYLLTLFFFALGLMAKPMLVTLPFVLLLLDYWPLSRLETEKLLVTEHKQSEKSSKMRLKKKERRRSAIKAEHVNKPEKQTRQRPAIGHIVLEKVPFFVLSLASSIVTYMAQQKGGTVGSLQSYPLAARIANALVSYCGYIGKMIWPENLAVLYPHPGMPPTWEVVASVFFLGITTFLIIRTVKRCPYLTTGWLWYLGTLVPVVGLVQVGVQAMADRYTYVPLIGISIMVAWGLPELLKKWRHRNAALATVVVIILCIFSFVTWKQLGCWQNSTTLFTHTLEKTTNNPIMLNNMGNVLEGEGRFDEAISHYTEALRIDPNLPDSYNNMGLALTKRGKPDEAISNFLKAIRINHNHAEAHYNMGTLLASQGKLDEAIYHFRESIRIRPEHGNSQYNLGLASMRKGNIDEAMSYFQQANRIDPFDPETILNMGVITAMRGNLNKAMDYFVKALQIKHDYPEAHVNWGLALMQKGNLDEAITHFREALKIKPDFKEAGDNLRVALAQQKMRR
jgi:tetratricopeptide (TPR) repeat protein